MQYFFVLIMMNEEKIEAKIIANLLRAEGNWRKAGEYLGLTPEQMEAQMDRFFLWRTQDYFQGAKQEALALIKDTETNTPMLKGLSVEDKRKHHLIRGMLYYALVDSGCNFSKAAESLGLSRVKYAHLLSNYGLEIFDKDSLEHLLIEHKGRISSISKALSLPMHYISKAIENYGLDWREYRKITEAETMPLFTSIRERNSRHSHLIKMVMATEEGGFGGRPKPFSEITAALSANGVNVTRQGIHFFVAYNSGDPDKYLPPETREDLCEQDKVAKESGLRTGETLFTPAAAHIILKHYLG